MTEERDKCEICGENLTLTTNIEDITRATCYFCKKNEDTQIICPNGHYICDECHSKGAIEIIEEFCEKTDLTNPFEIADSIMKHPNFKVYGPEHHVLVPAAILTSLKNLKIKNPDGSPLKFGHILEAIRRASKIPGGWCGYYGTCGAAAGSGVAMSVFLRVTPSTDLQRTISNQLTSRSLAKIADGLEHCCKRSVRHAISETLKILNEKYDLNLDFKPKSCIFSRINDKCEKEKCPFFEIK